MKVKELLKTVNVAWSPPALHPVLLAAGTAAQQLDASFSTNASLDLYSLNLDTPGYEMQLNASVLSEHRFHKIIWGPFGNNPAGVIVGGCDHGTIKIYSVANMLANEKNCLMSSPDRHKGPVRAMDFNPFQPNLLATGAVESEIYIWDLNNTSKPMTPGAKSVPAEDVQYIAWNKQVQHILASTFQQRCVIWDLRKNEAIIKLTDPSSKVRWKVVQWHPEVATQLCLASEEDQTPVIELWDLRFASSPLKTLQGHQRGVLSIAWNPHDSDLLLSCAKDNRIICWNPNTDVAGGEISCEFGQTNQWNFDVSWCPRHPGLFAGTSFDGHAAIYSLLGGHHQESVETSNKIVDSFPGMDPFTQMPPTKQSEPAALLKTVPKWLKRPAGASFGFGGKIAIFENVKVDPNMPQNTHRRAYISQVITKPELIHRSKELEAALASGHYSDFCKGKADYAENEHEKKVWNCINAYFGENVTNELLELLGFNIEEMSGKLTQYVPQDLETITKGISKLNNFVNGTTLDGTAAFDAIAEQEQQRQSVTPTKMSKIPDSNYRLNVSNDETGLITQAILLGNIDAAVNLCFNNKKYTEAIILSMAGGSELLAQTMNKYFLEHAGALNSLINSVVCKNWTDIVKACDISCWKEVLIGIFTHCSIEERNSLCDMLGDRLASCDNPTLRMDAQICYICSGNLNKMIETCNVGIQDTVELVAIMQKALEFQWSKKVQIEGNIATVLTKYAEMLAAEGDLEGALKYLGDSQEERIKLLRDRLKIALGYVQVEPHRAQSRPSAQVFNNQSYNQGPRTSFSSTTNNAFTPLQPAVPTQNWNTAPLKQTPYAPTITNQPFSNSSAQFPPPPLAQSNFADPYNQQGVTPLTPSIPPPPPASSTSNMSGGSRPSSVGPHARNKYLVDPSVKSSSYGQSTFANPLLPASPGFTPLQTSYQPSQSQSMYGGGGGFPQANPEPPQMYNPYGTDLNQRRASNYEANPAPQLFQPPPIQQTYENEISYQPSNEPPGWNDPPIAKLKKQPKSEFQRQDSHRAPTNVAPAQTEPNIYQPQNYMQPQQHGYHQDHHPHAYNPPPQQYQQPEILSPVSQPVAPVAKVSEPEKPKAPIPDEHAAIQNIFNQLKDQCIAGARNPQMARKIDDVARKLEVLYDFLREQKLSQNTLQGLHQISNCIQSGDYQGGLSVHTQLVSGPDFSQIASFMPGIKVLLQCALQLGVFIR